MNETVGWWHPIECIDSHDDEHNCLDASGSIIGWREEWPEDRDVPLNEIVISGYADDGPAPWVAKAAATAAINAALVRSVDANATEPSTPSARERLAAESCPMCGRRANKRLRKSLGRPRFTGPHPMTPAPNVPDCTCDRDDDSWVGERAMPLCPYHEDRLRHLSWESLACMVIDFEAALSALAAGGRRDA